MFQWVRRRSEDVVNGLITAGVIAGGGVVLTLLRAFLPNLFTYVLWCLIGSALTSAIVVAWILLRRIPKRLPETTPENVEGNIRSWLDAFLITTQKINEPNAMFGLLVTLQSGMKIVIVRPKDLNRYIQMETAIVMSPDDKARFDALSKEEQNIFGATLSVDLSRTGMGYVMDLPNNSVVLSRRIPITANLNESAFMEALEALDHAKMGMHRLLVLMLIKLKKQYEQQLLSSAADADAN